MTSLHPAAFLLLGGLLLPVLPLAVRRVALLLLAVGRILQSPRLSDRRQPSRLPCWVRAALGAR